ncbi:undecaprenyl-diphosphate phosphatase [bacterium]|nr:MAG: undecaprenyl-diphosphate phosphatase [bacterium]
MNLLEVLILSIIEGLTEFLPVSSTGHMILASAAMNLHENEFVKSFEIVIQLGAILAIVLMYAPRFLKSLTIYWKLGFAFFPTAVVGLLAYKTIKMYLFNPFVVATSLIIGGIILIFIDKKIVESKSVVEDVEDISYKSAFFIGLMQCISMIPGVSRAAATIIGGVFNGLNKKQATEFSFLLAVPTMFAAAGYDLLKTSASFTSEQFGLLGIGLVVAFISAWGAVKVFLKLVENYGFKHFGYYRIGIGVLFLVAAYFGWIHLEA